MTWRFTGESGRRPQTEARRYVYAVIAAMLDNLEERRWFFDGIDDEFDRRRLRKALDAVRKEMLRKGGNTPDASGEGGSENV